MPPSAKAIKDFGKALQNKAGNLKRLIPQRQAELAGLGTVSVGPNIEFSEVVENLKNGVGEVKDNFVDAIKNGNKGAIIKHPVLDNTRTGCALKTYDGQHGFDGIIVDYIQYAKEVDIVGGDGISRKLYQI
ncbi:hypothetical protein KYB31_23345 [Clostridium felsineum]|nr:hypothetical protein [Clostridium felsineum]MCR3761914.1 hypothetical protein [Clostridium felsineum]